MKSRNNSVKIDYESWLKKNGISINTAVIENVAFKESKESGKIQPSLFDEKDAFKVRLLVSDLVLKRDSYGIDNFGDYMDTIRLMVAYAEYLEEKSTFTGNTSPERDKTRDSLTIAYYLSRVNQRAVSVLGYNSFTQAFKGLAKILGQKTNTIKNMRDEFDPYFDNGRVGWYQRQLKGSRKEIYEKFKNISDKELTTIVKDILSVYINKAEKTQKEHKKIVIKSSKLKAIHSHKN